MQSLTAQRTNARGVRTARSRQERGFTLIETSIAFLVMMVALLALTPLFIYAMNYNSGAQVRTVAIAVAQQRMERLRKSSFNEVVSLNEPDVTSSGYHFSVTTSVSGTPLKTITVMVTPLGGSAWASRPVILVSQRASTGLGDYFQ
jgi:Tfp pilus assembly protein PilV